LSAFSIESLAVERPTEFNLFCEVVMRRNISLGLVVVAMLALVSFVKADDTSTTLKGTMTCAKCGLHQADECQSVLQVKDGDATVTYYIADSDASKGTHEKVCKAAVENVTRRPRLRVCQAKGPYKNNLNNSKTTREAR
jgi:hypothetical protein